MDCTLRSNGGAKIPVEPRRFDSELGHPELLIERGESFKKLKMTGRCRSTGRAGILAENFWQISKNLAYYNRERNRGDARPWKQDADGEFRGVARKPGTGASVTQGEGAGLGGFGLSGRG